MNKFALTHFRYFDTQDEQQQDAALMIENGHIEQWLPIHELPPIVPQVDAQGWLLAPGLIDIQVNGGGGVMLNNNPSIKSIDRMRRAHWLGGTTAMLPTLITDTPEVMQQAVEAVALAVDSLPGILGIHLEGPHLNSGKRGVHDSHRIRPLDAGTLELLTHMAPEHYLLTVAPEQLPAGAIRQLVEQGIRVSAGHTLASYEQMRAALAEGLSGFTHLYNAMLPMTGREPGAVGAALEDEQSYCGIIIDGYHLHPTVAKLAIRAKAKGKMILVTDAMATVGSEESSFELYGETIYAVNGRCAKEDGTLAGSALDMVSAVRNCVNTLEIALPEALRMGSLYPAQFLGISEHYGQLKAGARADFILLDEQLNLKQTWVLGQRCI
ncbi:N-acetylglucosamine-6-phosphate deacetylase [Thiofilum flexile]|uniref:N-acetylglucosamine-6-phosphate deacetylase n=1 Tax=Thiofilum flexile TaxID=125627 RepID=UPI00036FCEE6|nr:N-acetylglucosamine-6-phosphate deacetylase [Thiofilum flexile]